MRLLVLGASGACGRHVVRIAVERGHDVTAVMRPGSGYRPLESVESVIGQVTDRAFLHSVVVGHDTILSCLGLRRASILPWSRLLSPPDLVQRVTALLLDAVPPSARVIWISAGGVGDSRRLATLPIRLMIRSGHVGTAYDDLEVAESRVRSAGRTWLAVRPVTLVNGRPTGRASAVSRYSLSSVVRRGDVAQWMVDVADGAVRWDEDTVLLGAGGHTPSA